MSTKWKEIAKREGDAALRILKGLGWLALVLLYYGSIVMLLCLGVGVVLW